MVSDVPFGVCVGRSRLVAERGADERLDDAAVTTFYDWLRGEEDYNEFQFARQVSKRYETEHHETLISQKEAQDFLRCLYGYRTSRSPTTCASRSTSLRGLVQRARDGRWCRIGEGSRREFSSATGGANTIARRKCRSTDPARAGARQCGKGSSPRQGSRRLA
jgi:asparagine synthetase B (glutamine-hydrolysing)